MFYHIAPYFLKRCLNNYLKNKSLDQWIYIVIKEKGRELMSMMDD